jgi:hypothetical protein
MSLAVATSRILILLAAGLPTFAQDGNAIPHTGTVSGRVLGPVGQPMPNVEVIAARNPRGGEALAKTRTDAEGIFVMARLPFDSGCLILATTNGHTTGMTYASLGLEQPDAGVELRLWEANTLRGRVLDAAGKPLAGAVVLGAKDYTWFEGHFLAPEVNTDAEGRFELQGVPIGDCVIRAWAPGFVMREHALSAVADASVDVSLASGDGVTLAITTEGLPAEVRQATKVWIYPTRSGTGFPFPVRIGNNQLDGEGRLSLAGLPEVEWHVELSVPGFTFDSRSATVKSGPRVHSLPFRASRDGEVVLRGIVRSSDGTPLAGQTLLCRTQRSQSINGGRPGQATTGADGRFEMRAPLVVDEPYSLHLVGSNWVLEQEKPQGLAGESDLRYRVRWEEKASGRELDLVAVPAAFVSGRLVDAEQRPVPFVWTELQGMRTWVHPPWGVVAYATSMRDGTIRFPGVLGLDLDLRVHVQGTSGAGDSAPFRMAPGDRRSIDVVVQLPGVINGRLLDASGKPLAGVRVSLWNCDVASGGGRTNVCSDRQGRFVFTGVAPGSHRVGTDLYEPAGRGQSEVFEVAAGATVTTTLQLQ